MARRQWHSWAASVLVLVAVVVFRGTAIETTEHASVPGDPAGLALPLHVASRFALPSTSGHLNLKPAEAPQPVPPADRPALAATRSPRTGLAHRAPAPPVRRARSQILHLRTAAPGDLPH
jgi:hypothetical protein